MGPLSRCRVTLTAADLWSDQWNMPTNPDATNPTDLPEIRARRLAIVDERGDERIVAKVEDDIAVVEVSLPSNFGRGASIILVASPHVDDEVGPCVGLQGWAEDERKIEVDMWQESDGRWAVVVRTGGPNQQGVSVIPRGAWIEP